jgi:hypothetical protein
MNAPLRGGALDSALGSQGQGVGGAAMKKYEKPEKPLDNADHVLHGNWH